MMIIKVLSFFALIGSIAWFYAQPSHEPAIAIITSLIAFIAACLNDKPTKEQGTQNQFIGNNSLGIQAGGDIQIGGFAKERKENNVVSRDQSQDIGNREN